MVPDRAVQADQGGRYLLVVNQDDIVQQRYVDARSIERGPSRHRDRHQRG